MDLSFPASKACSLGVIILGAGASSRMGRPKLLLPWHGSSIIAHLIRQWQALAAAQIVVVCRPMDVLMSAELDRLSFPSANRIINPDPERGMFSSIQCAANWEGWQPDLSSWAIVLGDQPHLQADMLQTLLAFHARHPQSMCQPSHEGRGGHPILLPRTAFARLRSAPTQTLNLFLKQNADALVQCPVADARLGLDLDTPADYKQLILNQQANEKR
jgi:molybdenum cofactor cytidylyltransferase